MDSNGKVAASPRTPDDQSLSQADSGVLELRPNVQSVTESPTITTAEVGLAESLDRARFLIRGGLAAGQMSQVVPGWANVVGTIGPAICDPRRNVNGLFLPHVPQQPEFAFPFVLLQCSIIPSTPCISHLSRLSATNNIREAPWGNGALVVGRSPSSCDATIGIHLETLTNQNTSQTQWEASSSCSASAYVYILQLLSQLHGLTCQFAGRHGGGVGCLCSSLDRNANTDEPNSSFLAGALPLSMSLSQTQLRLISSIGVGVLVGTSMIVIIPEGIEASTAAASGHGHEHKVRSLMRRNPWAQASDIASFGLSRREDQGIREVVVTRSVVKRDDVIPAVGGDDKVETDTTSDPSSGAPQEEEHGHDHEHEHDHEHSHGEAQQGEEHHEEGHAEVPTFEIGFSMVLGFVLMFLIDRIPRHASERLHPALETHQFSLDTLGGAPEPTTSDEEQGFLGSLAPSPRQSRSLATTVGLVIHAAADGIAMGASSTAEDMKLGFIIFIAIMIHKAPAAFGLTSVLLKQGLSKRAARGHLIVFSLAAPVGALSTYLLIKLLGGGAMEGQHGQWWTGMLLLFSGGTFL